MNYLSKNDARTLAISNPHVMSFFALGYSETLRLTNDKVMNDVLVKPNDYFVNDDFESDPRWFVAHFKDQIYRVLRVIYVRPDCRGEGIGTKIVRSLQSYAFTEPFLQVGVQETADDRFARLDAFYKRLEFKRTTYSVDHGGGRRFHDYFWASKAFVVRQSGSKIAPYLLPVE